jgi:hypothetical protein
MMHHVFVDDERHIKQAKEIAIFYFLLYYINI